MLHGIDAGFGLLESGLVSKKDEVNIMMKNAIDVIVGGLSYWLFGYAFSFGDGVDSLHGFSGGSRFMLSRDDTDDEAGTHYACFFFHSSFATTATTIVSGERQFRLHLGYGRTKIGVNRPAFGGTVPHFHQMSRVPRNETDVPHF